MRAIVSASFCLRSLERAYRARAPTRADAIPQILAVAMAAAHGMQPRVAREQLQKEPRVLERNVGIAQQLSMRFIRVAEQAAELDRSRLQVRWHAPQSERGEHARKH